MKPLSKQFLISRGQCCGNGCKKCPYIPKNTCGNKMRDGLVLEAIHTLYYYDGPILTLVKNDHDYYLLAKESAINDNVHQLYLISKHDWCSLTTKTITLREAIDRSFCWSFIMDGNLACVVGGGEIPNNETVIVRRPIQHPISFDDGEIYNLYIDSLDCSDESIAKLNKLFCY